MKKGILTICSVMIVFAATIANAAIVNPRPKSGADFNSASLNTILNSNIHESGPSIDVVNDQKPNAIFTHEASGGALATMIIEIAGLADQNSFGMYQFGDTTNTVEIFSGIAGQGDQASIGFWSGGVVTVTLTRMVGGVPIITSNTYTGFGRNFGFYLNTPSNTWYTEDDQNSDNGAHALVYQGNGNTVLNIPNHGPGLFSKDEWIFAWEDVPMASSDKDYDDMVVLVESITPVPEPATIIVWSLLGVCWTGLAVARRRRFGASQGWTDGNRKAILDIIERNRV